MLQINRASLLLSMSSPKNVGTAQKMKKKGKKKKPLTSQLCEVSAATKYVVIGDKHTHTQNLYLLSSGMS